MDMQTVLNKYDLTLATVLSNESLNKLTKVYTELLETLTADSETQQAREKAIKDDIIKSFEDNPSEDISDIGTNVRQDISNMVKVNPDYLIPLVELLQEIKSDVITMRDFHIASLARENKPDKVKDTDEIAERKAEAEALRETIVSVFGLLGKPSDVIPVKTNKAGETVVDLPRIPGGNTTGNVGRGAIIRQMQFAIDGESLPGGTLFYDVLANYVNDIAKGNVIKVSDFKTKVEAEGFEFAPKGFDNRWTLECFGKTIEGWVPNDND